MRKRLRCLLLTSALVLAGGGSSLAQSPFDQMGGANRFSVSPQDQAAQSEARGRRHLAKARQLAKKAEEEGEPRATTKAAKEYERARKAFEEAISKDPSLAPAHLGLGEVALEQGRYPEALVACQAASQLAPGVLAARVCLLEAYLALGDLTAARGLVVATAASQPEMKAVLSQVLDRWRVDHPDHPQATEVLSWLAPLREDRP